MIVIVEFNRKDKLTRYYHYIKEIQYNYSTITLLSEYDTTIINPCEVVKMTIKREDDND